MGISLKIDVDIIQERPYKVNTSLFHWKTLYLIVTICFFDPEGSVPQRGQRVPQPTTLVQLGSQLFDLSLLWDRPLGVKGPLDLKMTCSHDQIKCFPVEE